MSNDQQACMMLDCWIARSKTPDMSALLCKLTDLYLMCCDYDALLFHAPGIPVDLGVELVVPSLPTLLANAPREKGRDQAPLPFTILLHQPAHHHLKSANLPSSYPCKLVHLKSYYINSSANQLGQACVQHADMRLLLIKCPSTAAANATVTTDLLHGREA